MINSTITKQTTYQINGADSGRIHKLLAQGCTCGCTRKLKPTGVVTFCTQLRNLSEEAVAHYFQTACDTVGEEVIEPASKRLRTEWYFLGYLTSVECLSSVLGMSGCTLYKKWHGALDMRKVPSPVGHTSPQRLIFDQYFCELYCSAAERLPEVEAVRANIRGVPLPQLEHCLAPLRGTMEVRTSLPQHLPAFTMQSRLSVFSVPAQRQRHSR